MFKAVSIFTLAAVCLLAQDSADTFYNAIRNGDTAALKKLIASGEVNVKDRRGSTPLMYAAAVGNVETMKLLLDAGADAKIRNGLDATALHWCTDNLDKVRLLVEHGAEVNAVTKSVRTPLAIAAGFPGNVATVAYLIEHGANVRFPGPPRFPTAGFGRFCE